MKCPECSSFISHGVTRCKCGWQSPHVKPSNHYCSRHGCNKGGSMAHTTKANENTKWYCGEHFDKNF